MMEAEAVMIRPYQAADRAQIRRICYATSFLGNPGAYLPDEVIVADVLTAYYTDYEPQSIFVACVGDKVTGYITGTLDTTRMHRVLIFRIMVKVGFKALCRGLFLRAAAWSLLRRFVRSFIRGEFKTPEGLVQRYPASFHINIADGYRGQGAGARLIEQFLSYAQVHHAVGVFCGTMSERSKDFFLRQGLTLVHQARRSFLDRGLPGEYFYYVLGREFRT